MDSDETVVGGGSDGWQELPAGTMLDNYRIERLLGRGGMGAVYLAEHLSLKKRYAVKVLPGNLSRDASFRDRFEAEGQRMAALEHPGVVPIHNAGESSGLRYFAMEYMAGGDLEQRLKAAGGRLPEDEVRDILRQLLEALAYAHGKGVVHRDLKPANILLVGDDADSSSPRIKIADFGLAQVVGDGYMKSVVEQTVAASMVGGAETVIGGPSAGSKGSASPDYAGTIDFMSPEVRGGEAATVQSDLYAVGVIGYYLLTGRRPIGMAKPPSQLLNSIWPGWDGWLGKLMEHAPGDRFADAASAQAALRLLVAKRDTSGGSDDASLELERLLGKSRSVSLGGSARWQRFQQLFIFGLVLAVIIGGFWLWKSTVVDTEPEKGTVASVVMSEDKAAAATVDNGVPIASETILIELPGGEAMRLRWIEPGELYMGSQSGEAGRVGDEGPQTKVIISDGFWIGQTPVTQGEWRALMRSSVANQRDKANPRWHLRGEGSRFPMYYVNWDEAMAFCELLTERERRAGRLPHGFIYTLPSEAQWEYVARAGSSSRWSFGDDISALGAYGWFDGNSGEASREVGSARPNPWGLYDMHGNVWEWTRSWYGAYPGGVITDYEGARSGGERVARGGSWYHSAEHSRSARRNKSDPKDRFFFTGFRVALVPER